MKKMKRNGRGDSSSPSVASPECCMCGDYGLSSELFKCKDCHFRSQHKYCSDLYPEAVSYDTCNWCVIKRGISKSGPILGKTQQDSSNSSSSSQLKIRINDQDREKIKKNKRLLVKKGNYDNKGLIEIKSAVINTQVKIKKCHKDNFSDDRSPPLSAAGRAEDGGGIAERVTKKTRPEDRLAKGGKMRKQVLRNKVIRRYKLLDEVSSKPVNASL